MQIYFQTYVCDAYKLESGKLNIFMQVCTALCKLENAYSMWIYFVKEFILRPTKVMQYSGIWYIYAKLGMH